jgi:hypothetical protein
MDGITWQDRADLLRRKKLLHTQAKKEVIYIPRSVTARKEELQLTILLKNTEKL